jgi:hypothetical protein
LARLTCAISELRDALSRLQRMPQPSTNERRRTDGLVSRGQVRTRRVAPTQRDLIDLRGELFPGSRSSTLGEPGHKGKTMRAIVLILIILLLLGGGGGFYYGGPYMGGGVGTVILVLLILAVLGVI